MTNQKQPNHTNSLTGRAFGLGLGVAIDTFLGDPKRYHPVALFGSYATQVERQLYADSVRSGTVHWAICVLPITGLGVLIGRWANGHFWREIITTSLATWAVLGARSLVNEGTTMANRLADNDLTAAREQLPNLCGRNPDALNNTELARATTESLAENCSDSMTGSLFWGSLLGIPGLLTHRAINTMDAMFGYKNKRYRHFGTTSAKVDDWVNWVPARITGVLACLLAPLVGGKIKKTSQIMFRDAPGHPSPNGGWCEAAYAGALNIQLGGRNIYGSRIEERALMGEGHPPTAKDVRQAARMTKLITIVTSGLAIISCLLRKRK